MRALVAVFVCCFVAVTVGQYLDPHCDGKQVIVHLFEWKWSDIAAECERYLGPKGFCGVQTSPPNEHVIINNPPQPWWQRYQPVSYKLVSRSGNEEQFADMVRRCNAVGVRIFPDVVINHMSGTENHGQGSGGTDFNGGSLSYPGVPYSAQNFNPRSKCPSGDGHVNNYGDPNNVRNCYLLSLTDLDQGQDYVRQKIVGYLNHMLDLGVAGFRVDASKHMWPGDIAAIQGATRDTQFGGKPFYMHEVIDQDDGAIKVTEYYGVGRVTEFRYCQKIKQGIGNFGALQGVFDPGWGMADNDHALIFVDNHDNQRGHGGGGQILTHERPREFRLANAFSMAWNYGFVRVMSSYSFGDNSDQGPPHNGDYSTADVPINSDGTCGGGWVCEHRWHAIGNMAAFRNAVAGTDVNHYDHRGDVVGFARGNKGFFAMGKGRFSENFQTGLPAGQYCDLISDCRVKVNVDGSGNAHIQPESDNDPVVAIIVGGNNNNDNYNNNNNNNNGGDPTQGPQPTVDYGSDAWRRTVILIERQTSPGQDMFIRGGLDHARHSGCSNNAASSNCAIPIRYRQFGSDPHFDKVKAWSQGDHFLDWYGAESGQGSYQGQRPEGTPAVWTTNSQSSPGYNSLNTYGEHYWMVDVDMDCSRTDNSFFEVKAIVGGWEGDIPSSTCSGSGGAAAPFTSSNHIARCGFVNVFHFNRAQCEIKNLS